MFKRALLSIAIIAGNIIAALNSSAPANIEPPARLDILMPATYLPETNIVDHSFVFIEDETTASAFSPASTGISC
jgi:hypothetical protein